MKGLGLKEIIVGTALALTPSACKSEADIRQTCEEAGQKVREETINALLGTGRPGGRVVQLADDESALARKACLEANDLQ